MRLDFMTPDVWNGLILGVVVIGLALAVLRIYSDLTRPLPPSSSRTKAQPTPTRSMETGDLSERD